MKSSARTVRTSCVSFLMAACLLLAPITAFAKKGEKNYRRGIQHEQMMQWEKAAQEFALAVAANPSDIEYQLHYRRSVFNASQVYMQRGRALAEQGDFTGAYNAFRQAYGYDSVNELAVSEMGRMLRLQRAKEGLEPENESDAERRPGSAIAPVSLRETSTPNIGITSGGATPRPFANASQQQQPSTVAPVASRSEQLRVINYNGELEPFIRKLAEELDLNVVFDKDFGTQQKRNIQIQWRNVTTAQALDYIFQAYGLFFQKLSRRTILVADQSKRPQYQQLALRTFYLSNIEPEQARQLIQQTLPANAGRQPQVVINKATNSITVRDTPENIRLIGELLQSVDKDRAEVVMEVAIYEVSRTDLLQIGNQIGTDSTLAQLGGTGGGIISLGNRTAVTGALGISPPTALGAAILLPASTITALQTKDNTRLVFQTQVHAFDDEKSETRIGQKVPVQTAQVSSFGTTVNNSGTPNPTGGVNNGLFGGTGFPVIQYEDTGLSLDFKPRVFPNQDVQVEMVIETKDASFTGSGNATTLTPIFSQRRIKGTARIPNNRTMMIASIASDRQSDGRAGLPILGLIPVLGRLFSAPRRNNTESDVVITMTPRVLRAPQVTPRDEEMRPGGSQQNPLNESLEAFIRESDREEQLAAARQLPTNAAVQLPPATETVSYVPAPKVLVDPAKVLSGGATQQTGDTATGSTTGVAAATTFVANRDAAPASNFSSTTTPAAPSTWGDAAKANGPALSSADLSLVSEASEMRVGARQRLALRLKTDAPLGLATATFRFDPRVVAVRGVSAGTMFETQQTSSGGVPPFAVSHSVDPTKGVLVVTVAPLPGTMQPLTGDGVLVFVEVEAIAPGDSRFNFDAGKVHLVANDGRSVVMQAVQTALRVLE